VVLGSGVWGLGLGAGSREVDRGAGQIWARTFNRSCATTATTT